MSITFVIIGVNVLLSFIAFNNRDLLYKLMMNPYHIHHDRQYFRFLTSGFVHGNYSHLLFNMFSLYFFGPAVEHIFNIIFGAQGSINFILLYVLAIIASDIPTYFKNRNNPAYNSLGASGAISAIVFAFIIFQPLQNLCIFLAICMPGFILGTLYIVFSYYQGRRANDGINHEAHLYGALFGFVFCVVTYPRSLAIFFEQIRQWEFLH
jgi:membrane associated rhomboid family serine protease